MPVVVTPTRRKFRGLARSRIRLGLDALDRLVNYAAKHPDKELFDAAQLTAIATVETALLQALAAVVP